MKAGRVIPGLNKSMYRESFTPSKETLDSIKEFYQTGDMDILCNLVRTNPFHVNLPPLICQLWWLKLLCTFIDDNAERPFSNPNFDQPPTHEFLRIEGKKFKIKSPWKSFPVGTRQAAHQALVDLTQEWVQGFLPGYSVQKSPSLAKGTKHPRRPGRKETRSSYEVYGEYGVRVGIFYHMLETITPSKGTSNHKFTKEDFKKRGQEKPAAFEARTIKLVQRIHQECGLDSPFTSGGWLGGPPVRILPLPRPLAKTIAKYAMKTTVVTKKDLLYGLLSVYEVRRNPIPKNFNGIKHSIAREEAEFPEFIPEEFHPSTRREKTSTKPQ